MKQSEALKHAPIDTHALILSLKRKKAYVIQWRGNEMVIQITHFHKKGIVFKPLSTVPMYRHENRTGCLDYDVLYKHKLREATLHDITCHMGTGTKFMSAYYGDVKTFLRNHSQEALSCASAPSSPKTSNDSSSSNVEFSEPSPSDYL